MQKTAGRKLNEDDWVTVRDFTDDGVGFASAKFEAKYVEDIEKRHVDGDVVLVRETRPGSEFEKMHFFPKEAVEGLCDRLPE
jgi:hypothetical protein